MVGSIDGAPHLAISGLTAGDRSMLRASSPIISGVAEPPSYVVRLLFDHIGIKTYRGGDRVVWESFVDFKGIPFQVRDWKNSSWSIVVGGGERHGDGPQRRKEAESLRDAIVREARKLDHWMQARLRESIEGDNFYINNSYNKIRNAYERFRENILSFVEERDRPTRERDRPTRKSPGNSLVAPISSSGFLDLLDLNENISINGYAMAGMYYSATEMLFDIMFALGDEREQSFKAFSQLDWATRFKSVLPLSDPEVKEHYDRLLQLKRSYRDPIYHGLGKDAQILVPFEQIGLVPLSYEYLTQSIHYSLLFMDDGWAIEALAAFDQFDDWLREHDPYSYAVKLGETGFAVPLFGDFLAEIRAHTSSHEEFEEWAKNESRGRDYLSEQY